MASLSAKFLLVTVLVHLGLIPLAVHAEAEQELTTNPESVPSVLLLQYDAEAELKARWFFSNFFKNYLMDCSMISSFAESACTKLKDNIRK
ncbi:hypothetical protein NFI96_030474 [Prochilodus magdalenae]|nr:hypothetical protein NFI96_030474 [Prochilodus magdalenae]